MESKFDIKSSIENEQKNKKNKKKVIKYKPIKVPNSIEIDYYIELRYMLEQIKERAFNIVLNGLDKPTVKEVIHDESISSKVNKLVSEFKQKIKSQFDLKRLLDIVKKTISKTDRVQKVKFLNAIQLGFGIDISNIPEFKAYKPFINMSIKRNLTLVKSLRDQTLDKLETMLRTSIEQGTSIEQMRKDIQKEYNVSKKRATLIARNEIKNVTAMLNKKRLLNVGFEQAIWQTSEDDRVRSTHKHFDGKIYTIGKGLQLPDGRWIEPRDEINCRCEAIPYIKLD